MAQYLPIVALLILAVLFGVISYGADLPLARAGRRRRRDDECDIGAVEPPKRFPVGFYVVAMLFIMFDIEIVFIYPYAVSHATLGIYGFWAVFVFLGDLLRHVRVRGGAGWAATGARSARRATCSTKPRWSRPSGH